MISKELIQIVLNVESKVRYVDVKPSNNNIVEYDIDFCRPGEINIYELTQKCKEWLYINEYLIQSDWTFDNKLWFEITICKKERFTPVFHRFNKISEPEAIFEACQWILDNKKSLKWNFERRREFWETLKETYEK